MKEYTNGQMKNILTLANNYAEQHSTCLKTKVGCYLVEENAWRTVISKGANCGKEDCRDLGCLRVQMFGDNSKEHRSTCRCNHSEIDALNKVQDKSRLKGATAFVTRYPCINCAKALVKAGITRIVYGRPFEIEPETKKLLEENKISVIHVSDWNCDEQDTNN